MLPVFLNLENKPVLVVGGGPVALRRSKKLLAAGAKVTVYAEAFLPEFRQLRLELKEELFAAQSLAGYWLVVAATNDQAVNAAIARRAEKAGIFCGNAGDGGSGDVIFPLHIREKGFDIAMADRYQLPFLLKRLGHMVAETIPAFTPAYLEKLRCLRRLIIEKYPGEKEALLGKLADLALDNQNLEEEPDEIIRRLQRK